jgi:2-methylisocitrate lyase-like PEP mutase family enzyme
MPAAVAASLEGPSELPGSPLRVECAASMDAQAKRGLLAAAVRERRFVIAPGVFDMVSAKLADRLDFGALYMSGYGISASHLGLPDAGLASYRDVLERVRVIAQQSVTPLICDADTGFGGLLNVRHTVRGFEEAGCAAIQIEDQAVPKKCGFTPGRRVIAVAAMVDKIRVALEARHDPDLLIIARTDARSSLGFDESLQRARAYAAAGADVIFVQGLESVAELEQVAQAVSQPLLVNMGIGGKTPALTTAMLERMGYVIAIYPNLGLLAAAAALEAVYGRLRQGASPAEIGLPAAAADAMHRLMGFEEVWAFEARWRDRDSSEPD